MVEPENNESEFSLQDFKKWMNENARQHFAVSNPKWRLGTEVEINRSLRKFIARMEPTDGDVTEMAREFKRSGGMITEIDGLYSRIDVVNGSFVIPTSYVRPKQN